MNVFVKVSFTQILLDLIKSSLMFMCNKVDNNNDAENEDADNDDRQFVIV